MTTLQKETEQMNKLILTLYEEELDNWFSLVIGKYGVITPAQKGVRSFLIDVAATEKGITREEFLVTFILNEPKENAIAIRHILANKTGVVGIEDGIIYGTPNKEQQETIEWLRDNNYM